jgi:hypothetical protein
VQKSNGTEEKRTLFSAKVVALEIACNWSGKPNKINGEESKLFALFDLFHSDFIFPFWLFLPFRRVGHK